MEYNIERHVIHSLFNLNDPATLYNLEQDRKNLDRKLELEFIPEFNAVEVKYDGKYFDTFSQFCDGIDDTIILRSEHLDLSIRDLTVIGTVYHLEDTNHHSYRKQVDGDSITSDSIIFELSPNGDPVTPVIFIDPKLTKPASRYSGTHHQLYLDYLEAEISLVEIHDTGIMDAGELAFRRELSRKFKTNIEVSQYNAIQLQIYTGYPVTVKELLDVVRSFKKKVNENIK